MKKVMAKEIIKDYTENKLTRTEIAVKYKHHRNTITRIIKENGIKIWDGRKKTKKFSSRYFSWKELKGNIMCFYNRDK